jgi:hypothetical protein
VQTAQVDQMLDFISRLFGDRNEKETKKLKPIVDEINRYAEEYKSLSEDELKGKTAEFKARIAEATAQIVERKVEILATLKGGRSQDTSENGQEIPQRSSPSTTATGCPRNSTISKKNGLTSSKAFWTRSCPKRSRSSRKRRGG